jgi:uncharacterized protein YjbI with pentapeptide repeats
MKCRRSLLVVAWLSAAVLVGELLGHARRPGDFFEDASLRGSRAPSLRGAQLAARDLARTDLRYTCLADADLRHANLRDAQLCVTDLTHADLTAATLLRAQLQEANLRRAILVRANLCGANLRSSLLDGVSLEGARYDIRTQWPTGFDPGRHGAVLIRTPADGVTR